MQYFKNFSSLYYNINGNEELVIDILKRAMIKSNVVNNVDAYLEYEVKSGDTMQSISYSIYDSVYPFWIIMLINQELNPYTCLPIDEQILLEQSENKYGKDNLYNIHHYEDEKGNVIDSPLQYDSNTKNYYRIINGEIVYINENLIPYNEKTSIGKYKEITNWQYEINNNEKKRKIKLLRPEYLDSVINEFYTMVG